MEIIVLFPALVIVVLLLSILAILFFRDKIQKAPPKEPEKPVGSTYFADPPATEKKD